MPRILCVWSPSWAISTWRRRNPQGPGPEHPFALVANLRGVRKLTAVNPAAAALGLFVDQKAADAFALTPDLILADADPQGDHAALEALSDWCARFSPAVAPDPPDGLFLDITGVDHLWGGEQPMMNDLLVRLAANGVPARAATAATPGAAWALAHFGEDRTVCEAGDETRLMADLPVAALRLAPEDAAQLSRLGLTRIGRLSGIPRAALARRFGRDAAVRLDQALRRTEEALTFRRPPTPWFDRLAFAEPISVPEDLVRAAEDVARKLCARLEAAGSGARRFEIAFHRLDGRALRAAAGLALPARDPERLVRLIAPKLDYLDPGFGIEAVTLIAYEVERLGPRQARLDTDRAVALEDGLAPLVDRLSARLGEDAVWRAEPFASHAPERAVARRPALSPASDAGWGPDRPRPLRLLRPPEPIEALALTPDEPPRQFRWRGLLHRVRRAEGPERIAQEWWRQPPGESGPGHVRDYYRVEDEVGGRFWLFRAGLYGAGDPPRWWLHGLFA